MACRTEREEPGPRYHPCSFGRTSENRGKLSLLTELRQGLQMAHISTTRRTERT